MRTLRLLTLLLTAFFVTNGMAQSPEQLKMMEEMEKKYAEAMRMQDSMMNTSDMKTLMGQIQAQEENNKAEREKENALKQEQETKVVKKRADDFYWRNTIASDTNGKFSKWTMGAADFGVVGYALKDGTGRYKFIKMGTITADGKLTYDLPKHTQAKAVMKASNELFTNSGFMPRDFQLAGGETGFISSFSMVVVRDNKRLGNILMGNNIRVATNLAAPCCNNYGDEGYRVFWSYAAANCGVTGTKNFKYTAMYGELDKSIDRSTSYNLDFKPGWNLIKTESIGYEILGNLKFAKVRKNSLVQAVPSDTKYFFTLSEDIPELKITY